jgi:hypothetical protein
MNSRVGKIARLPHAVRNLLNQRLHDGEPGPRLLAWLNALPEVQAVLAAEFAGRPINAQNLSDWKQGGYRDWVAQQEALAVAQRLGEDAAELQAAGRPPLTDTLAAWLAARYAVATRQLAATEGVAHWRRLRELCADLAELRRGDHSAERLRLEREHLALARERTERERIEAFMAWADRPEVRERLRSTATREEQIQALGRLMFGEDFHPVPDGYDSQASAESVAAPPSPAAAMVETVSQQG